MDWGSSWEFFWHLLVIFAWFAYLLVLFQILVDLLWRDHDTRGWVKAVWVVFLFVIPWLTALVYVITRGRGMTLRAHRAAAETKQETDNYIKNAAGHSPAQQIADAKALLDNGAISQAEFDTLKAKALN